METFTVKTTKRVEMIDITAQVRAAIGKMKVREGICVIYCPHTTAAITINENADPDVPRDILAALERAVPFAADYRHAEGNAAAHVKSSLVGASEIVIVEEGRPVLGTWQSVFFCEFDGPRTRRVCVKIWGHHT
ncbi:MAG TPA: secondary thiamine-phosphate synthase enzyme YjbQ [Syntrophales bacterium]|nr:secondary thiamine-phosphate synthase enzyme YjbQ [Syntrophales bacterium]HOM08140.1 secondary thiamine-phosphate synthase enzyme YjbQ [Syntrophales bacterium]HOO00962.1 secondary thiamine-phosphate synthase enzyme YjbQ [Syntrophales bacterium]HPC34008.1 secondary thiamine-phosphate synthase enzyme YjbQ [Syntrophales bacterium]